MSHRTQSSSAVFELLPDVDRDAVEEARVQGGFRGALPGLRCHACRDTLADDFVCYPCIDVRTLDPSLRLTRFRTVTLEAFREIAARIRLATQSNTVLVPGGPLGPFANAKASKLEYDVEWSEPWLPLMRLSILEALKRNGLAVKYAPVPIRVRGKLVTDYAMPHVEPIDILAPLMMTTYGMAQCPVCGDISQINPFGPRIEHLFLRKDARKSVPPFFRDLTTSGSILVSDAARGAIQSMRLSGVRLSPIGEWC